MVQSHASSAGAHHGHQTTPTQRRLAQERRERLQRLGMVAPKQNPPTVVLFQEPTPIEPAAESTPPVDPYREQFAEAWRMLGESGAVNTIDPVIRACCDYFKVNKTDMISSRRTAAPVLARQVAMYLCRKLTIRSLPDIGRRFGGRDHTTVLHAVRKIERIKDQDEQVNRAVRELTSQLSSEKEAGDEFSL